MASTHQPWTPELRIRLGLVLCAAGLLMLVYGIVPRVDGRVTYGDRDGPMKTIERDASPKLFGEITYWNIAFGTMLTVGGLGLAWSAARSRTRG